MMIVKKLLTTNMEGNIETTKREIKELSEDEEKKVREFVDDLINNDGDPESYYSKGISDDFNGDLVWINFDSLCDYVEDRLSDLKEEKEEDSYEFRDNKEILPIIIKYKGYTF